MRFDLGICNNYSRRDLDTLKHATEYLYVAHRRLEDETYRCPWGCGMARIVLDDRVANLLELVKQFQNFPELFLQIPSGYCSLCIALFCVCTPPLSIVKDLYDNTWNVILLIRAFCSLVPEPLFSSACKFPSYELGSRFAFWPIEASLSEHERTVMPWWNQQIFIVTVHSSDVSESNARHATLQ